MKVLMFLSCMLFAGFSADTTTTELSQGSALPVACSDAGVYKTNGPGGLWLAFCSDGTWHRVFKWGGQWVKWTSTSGTWSTNGAGQLQLTGLGTYALWDPYAGPHWELNGPLFRVLARVE
jgi:hypothetical protein